MSKVGKIAIYAAKQYAKEQERKRKLEEKEQLRVAKERTATCIPENLYLVNLCNPYEY